MDYVIARKRMVEEILIPRGIRNREVIEAMGKVPRHLFVEEALAGIAYTNNAIRIGCGQTISQPYMVALMTEALEPKKTDRILEIGTGSGYHSAILAELVDRVYSVEMIKPLAEKARKILDKLGYYNVNIKIDDGIKGWKEKAPFDGILVTAAAKKIPMTLLDQLKIEGHLIIPIEEDAQQQFLKLITKKEGGKVWEKNLGRCKFVKLLGENSWDG